MAAPTQSALAKVPTWGKFLIGVLAAGLSAFVYWFFFYSEASAKIEGALRQKQALRDEFAQQQQAQASYFADRDELAVREQRARELNKVLPPDSQEDAFLSSVQSASNAAGIDLKGYAPQEEVSQNFYAKVPMKLEMSGKFQQIAKFAFELGKADRIINVENIELTEPKLVGDEVILHARCLATAFHALKPKEAPRGPAAPGPAAHRPPGGTPPVTRRASASPSSVLVASLPLADRVRQHPRRRRAAPPRRRRPAPAPVASAPAPRACRRSSKARSTRRTTSSRAIATATRSGASSSSSSR